MQGRLHPRTDSFDLGRIGFSLHQWSVKLVSNLRSNSKAYSDLCEVERTRLVKVVASSTTRTRTIQDQGPLVVTPQYQGWG